MTTKCYIGFSKPNTFKIGAELIKWWINKSYSHAYIRFESEKLSTIYQASHGMVHFKEFNNFLKENTVVVEYSWILDIKVLKEIMLETVFLAGEKYGYLDLLVILFYDITGWDLGNTAGEVCSSLVAKIYKNNSNVKFHKETHLIRPNDLEEVIKNG